MNFLIAYPTNVSITIVSDAPPSVSLMLTGLGITGVTVWDRFNAAEYGNVKYGLLYEHRHVMQAASTAGTMGSGYDMCAYTCGSYTARFSIEHQAVAAAVVRQPIRVPKQPLDRPRPPGQEYMTAL